MTDAHRRKKNPDEVRRRLIESARRLALAHGFSGVGQAAVAAEAGVTKGGLVHHFPSKQALVEAVFQHMLEEFEATLEALIAADPDPWGRFTRAYVETAFDTSEAQWGPLWMTTLTDPALRRMWGAWFNAQRRRHGEATPDLEAARFAADGVWLGQLVGVAPEERDRLKSRLISLTRHPA